MKTCTLCNQQFNNDNNNNQCPSCVLPTIVKLLSQELIHLPQTSNSTVNVQPWVYPPAYSGIAPLTIAVIDPSTLWSFVEPQIRDRFQLFKGGGIKRIEFTSFPSLPPSFPQYPIVHILLLRCETLQEYHHQFKARIKSFVEEMQRNQREFVLVGIETTQESKSVYELEKSMYCVTISDGKRNLDGQWGALVNKLTELIRKGFETRLPDLRRVDSPKFLTYCWKVDALARALIQVDEMDKALDLYREIHTLDGSNEQVQHMQRAARLDLSGSSVKRLPIAELLFFPSQTFPSQLFNVDRMAFVKLMEACTISSIQFELYTFTRIVLLLLHTGRCVEALESGFTFVLHMQGELLVAYPEEEEVVLAWIVSACLELTCAGHACAAERALLPHSRVALCWIQAKLLERALDALRPFERPKELTHAMGMREDLLRACLAHFVGAGKFRYAAAMQFRLGDWQCAKWWSGLPRLDFDSSASLHDHWPRLLCECDGVEITPDEYRSIFPLEKRGELYQFLPVELAVDCFTGIRCLLTYTWVLPMLVQIQRVVVTFQNKQGKVIVYQALESDLTIARRLRHVEFPGEYTIVSALVHTEDLVYKVYIAPHTLVIENSFPFALECEDAVFCGCLETEQHVEASVVMQQLRFTVKCWDDDLAGDEELFAFVGANDPMLVSGESFQVQVRLDKPAVNVRMVYGDLSKEFDFSQLSLPVLRVQHLVLLKNQNAGLSFKCCNGEFTDNIVIQSFTLESNQLDLVSPPPEAFPMAIETSEGVFVSFVIENLDKVVPPRFSVTAVFVLHAHAVLLLDNATRLVELKWNVALHAKRGDVCVMQNWNSKSFEFNNVPPVVSITLGERDLGDVQDDPSVILLEMLTGITL